MEARVLKSYHIGDVSVHETDRPDTVKVQVDCSMVELNQSQFRALCGLNYQVSFVKAEESEESE